MLRSLAFVALASFYQWTDANGVKHFSDQPHPGAIILPGTQSQPVSSPHLTMTNSLRKISYHSLEIVLPLNQASIYNNSGDIEVSVNVDPVLQMGDSLKLMLDGKQVAISQDKQSFKLTGIERGTHNLQAQIIDNKNQLLKTSDKIIFYMHQTMINPVLQKNN